MVLSECCLYDSNAIYFVHNYHSSRYSLLKNENKVLVNGVGNVTSNLACSFLIGHFLYV